MAKVYVLLGIMGVITVTGLSWLIIAKFGQILFRGKKRENKSE